MHPDVTPQRNPRSRSLNGSLSVGQNVEILNIPIYEALHRKGFEGSTPIFSLSEPDLLRDVLVKDFHIFHYRRHVDVYDPLTKNLVSILEGEDWKRVRTIVTPAFTSKRMRQMGSIIDDCSKSLIETCERSFKDGKPVECKGLFSTFTMDVIARAAFGTQIDSHNDPENAFLKEAKKTFMEPKILTILMA
ncbi:Cytochrome P450 3A5, partial [Araneus ventricosus]